MRAAVTASDSIFTKTGYWNSPMKRLTTKKVKYDARKAINNILCVVSVDRY